MWRHAGRALPWLLIGLTSSMLLVLLLAVRWDAWTLWPLQGVAVGLLAGAVGWCLDEPAAAVVDTAPRGLAWRTAARLGGVSALLVAWSAGVRLARPTLFDHPLEVLLQGFAAAGVAAAWVTWRRSKGEATPGQRWAVTVVPLVTVGALVRPFERHLPVFPYGYTGPEANWRASAALWCLAGVASLGALVLVLVKERQN